MAPIPLAGRRVFGLETEFGCLVRDPAVGDAEGVVHLVKDHAFLKRRLGLLDLHARDLAFEPPRTGGFLTNGGRLYIDMVGSHEEYATPECMSLDDLLTYDRAGRALLVDLLDDLGLTGAASFHCNSVDHFGGHTFGCHENYLVRIEEDAFVPALAALLPFLVTRQVYAGVGRVGGHRLTRPSSKDNVLQMSEHEIDTVWVSNFYGVEIDPTVDFQLSQRADHIVRAISSRVRFNRAIINPKWDSYNDYEETHRLHILFGEANMSEYAAKLKVGATVLVLDLLEMREAPDDLALREPLIALRQISRDPSLRWLVRMEDGRTLSAIDIQRRYLTAADRLLAGRDEQTDWVLREWRRTLDDLQVNPLATADRLDWAAKRSALSRFMEAEGGSWQDDVMQSLDLEYHNVDSRDGLHAALEDAGEMPRLTSPVAVHRALTGPPQNTRAMGRAMVIEELLRRAEALYVIDWDAVYVEDQPALPLRNPFHTYEREAARFTERLRRG